jgi:voltage-gated potassium channel
VDISKKIFELIDPSSGHHKSKVFDIFIMSLIFLSVMEVILESFDSLNIAFEREFALFENFSVIVFTIEYLLRLLTADLKYKGKGYFISVLTLMFSFFGLIDLIAILPFYLPLLITMDLRFVRILRLLRLFRALKLARYNKSIALVVSVLKEKRPELGITLFVTFILMLLASTLMYFAEHDAQPEEFPNIVGAFWWAVTTLTTVGYGDVYPITVIGKVIASLMALLGIAVVALPTGIISSAFFEKTRQLKKNAYCPHCGEPLNGDH